jgi:hypothetical protein
MQIARAVVELAIGEQMDGSPLSDANAGKNPAAVALGKLGGPRVGAQEPRAFHPSVVAP